MNGLLPEETIKVYVSEENTIQLPEEFCKKLNAEYALTLDIHVDHIVIRPVPKDPHDFYEKLLTQVIEDGFKDKKLIAEVRKRLIQHQGIARAIAADARAERKNVEYIASMKELEAEERLDRDDWQYESY